MILTLPREFMAKTNQNSLWTNLPLFRKLKAGVGDGGMPRNDLVFCLESCFLFFFYKQ